MATRTDLSEKQEARLVAWVNKQRDWRVGCKGRIKRLPRGVCDDPFECVLGRALGSRARLNGDGTWYVTPHHIETLPKYVHAFERRFDAGEHPSLIDRRDKPRRADIAEYYERFGLGREELTGQAED